MEKEQWVAHDHCVRSATSTQKASSYKQEMISSFDIINLIKTWKKTMDGQNWSYIDCFVVKISEQEEINCKTENLVIKNKKMALKNLNIRSIKHKELKYLMEGRERNKRNLLGPLRISSNFQQHFQAQLWQPNKHIMPEGNHIHYIYEYTLFTVWLLLRASYSKTLGGHIHYVFKLLK